MYNQKKGGIDMNETKKLYRITEGKMLAGVCGGIAEYFNLDASLVRLGWVLISMLGGAGILAYIIGMIIIPEKPAANAINKVASAVVTEEVKTEKTE